MLPHRTVHLLVRSRLGPSMSDYLVSRIRATPNISVHEGEEIAAVHGERRLESVVLRRSGTPPISAVFVFIGAEPGGSWLPDTGARGKLGYILTGIQWRQTCRWPLRGREPRPL